MSQNDTTREKRVVKDAPETAQYWAEIAASKERRAKYQYNKEMKAQGVGSTLPTTKTTKAIDTDELPGEEFDATLAEIRAEEARIEALRANIALRDKIPFNKLKVMDEEELEKIWEGGGNDKGKGKGKTKEKEKGTASLSTSSRKSQVTAMGPVRRIESGPTKTPIERAKRKRSSPKSKSGKRSTTVIDAARPEGLEVGSDEEPDSEDEDEEDDEDDEDEDKDEEEKGRQSKKPVNGKGQRSKTSDFTGIVKKMLNHTTVLVCAELVATGMFGPRSEYNSLVKKTWAGAAAEFGVNVRSKKYKLRKAHKQAIRARVNSFRSRIRDKLKPTVATVYELLCQGLTPEEAKQRVKRWFPHRYHTKVGAGDGLGHFQHDMIQTAIYESYYSGQTPVGVTHPKLFDPMPLEAMALVCAVIRWIINQHDTGKYKAAKMTFDKLREYYEETMVSLKAFETGKQATRCAIVRRQLHLQSMELAGCAVADEEPPAVNDALSDQDFAEDIPTKEEMKLIAGMTKKQPNGSLRTEKSTAGGGSNPLSGSNTTQTNGTDGERSDRPHTARSHSSDGLRTTGDTTDNARSRRASFSSVSLDQEDFDESRETTPTPGNRPSQANSSRRNILPIEVEEDEDEDEDKSDVDNGKSDDEDESESDEAEPQQPPKKKLKKDTSATLLSKLVAGQQAKLTAKESKLLSKLKQMPKNDKPISKRRKKLQLL